MGHPDKHYGASGGVRSGVRTGGARALKPLLAATLATTCVSPLSPFFSLLRTVTPAAPSLRPSPRTVHLVLLQGVMSAVSAGMLIYAACVEMLAGDFVMDAHLWRSAVSRQALALASLLLGVAAMAAIG